MATTSRSPSLITSIEIFRVPPRWIFIRVQTSDGIIGWGEGSLEGHTEAVEGAYFDLRERFVGWDADNIQDIWQTAYRSRFHRGGPVLMSALSGLDIALWDIKGKKLGVPVWQLLGGKVRDRVRVHCWIGGDDVTDLFGLAMVRIKQGFTAVKLDLSGGVNWVDSPSVLDDTATRVKDVRSLGLDVIVDFRGRLHKGMAKRLAKLVEPHSPLFITEPFPPAQPDEVADLAKSTATPIGLGARLYSRSDFRPYLEKRALEVAQPSVSHCGGISELYRIAALAETYDVALAPYCPLGPIALAACIQVALAAPNFTIQEMNVDVQYNVEIAPSCEPDLHTYLLNPEVFNVKEGFVSALSGPGLGIELNERLIREYSIKYVRGFKAWRNPVMRGKDGGLLDS
ncbi:enolase C-terminal domain-like protein [Pluteus cervinus]|uniref:Enolase C-terminal domain-like protein n=1 Tax=Pluteus cervinus TaxID=181527 RepID=A0ACD3B5V4_9AGAR|nr:enolase C-terminal domain-like protein [Pluteus cervinus]